MLLGACYPIQDSQAGLSGFQFFEIALIKAKEGVELSQYTWKTYHPTTYTDMMGKSTSGFTHPRSGGMAWAMKRDSPPPPAANGDTVEGDNDEYVLGYYGSAEKTEKKRKLLKGEAPPKVALGVITLGSAHKTVISLKTGANLGFTHVLSKETNRANKALYEKAERAKVVTTVRLTTASFKACHNTDLLGQRPECTSRTVAGMCVRTVVCSESVYKGWVQRKKDFLISLNLTSSDTSRADSFAPFCSFWMSDADLYAQDESKELYLTTKRLTLGLNTPYFQLPDKVNKVPEAEYQEMGDRCTTEQIYDTFLAIS